MRGVAGEGCYGACIVLYVIHHAILHIYVCM